MWNLSCTKHDLQTDEGIMPMHGLQSPDFPAEDAKEAEGVCPTTISMPEPPGYTEEAGGVPAAAVETPEPHEDIQEAGGAHTTIVSMPEQLKDPEGPKNTLLAEEVNAEAFDACTPAEDKQTACSVAQVPASLEDLILMILPSLWPVLHPTVLQSQWPTAPNLDFNRLALGMFIQMTF